jgi:hypothetical protein
VEQVGQGDEDVELTLAAEGPVRALVELSQPGIPRNHVGHSSAV